ncbi:MotA/TolQ/ExbB proton channel family protein [Burkholderia cepacia]|uniref:MotA/TolQ/ExbB proton channel family protein n=1 Tax=Burkholderia cepacia TaxID=292 RepID=UPI001C935987|nr:MotA/TolQ/ExbB proton channel family protein [Burkholderia cepacia]MBY4712878.1 MotA/TolQ/ExbB proton channel family protein [Burkholderia cepacia]MBY4734687.1 MotA/TolQ/ExbB proton channel family protein [Burkholderia cepacia]MBY4744284.1 MotA/TolQ/ExbB proton channel family protein [Burkholderia cepacia]MBY4757493.1 MotA/TolQ/ExbB proton channel family protein [Burkholderia cepacia]MBY4774822.1 MotA/TolQ/ExbB proton channel family protein [Burkholderia cepacia]
MTIYGIEHVWTQGDPMTRAVALLLVAMSIASWTVIVIKAIELVGIRRRAARAEARFRGPGGAAGATHALGGRDRPFVDLVRAGQAAIAHHEASRHRLHDRIDASDWLSRSLKTSVDESAARMQRGLGVLASIGSTAPFVGLLGTVWGIYHALLSLGATGEASLDRVAGPVGEALVMTAFGLCVAIPAVLGYNTLVRLSRDIVARLNRFAHGLHLLLLTGSVPETAARPEPATRMPADLQPAADGARA